ncbi:MAG: molybdopterin molybdenumtransferase MoeA, partial [Clostridia bacterium]|nr:molybdopterin molybdenumtransferase MoeA [Clostridia bacterium]
MKRKYISVARSKAVELICSNLHYLQTQEIVTLSNALNRVAAKDIKSFNTLPNTMNSRWDCVFFYYDRWLEDKGDTSLWELGKDYIYANTGVAIKGDHDTGVKVENTKIDKDNRLVLLEKNIQKGQNTQPVGEWLKEGEIVVKANTKILPAHLNILAAAGVTEVPVYRKPKVGFIATGNELVSAGQNLP